MPRTGYGNIGPTVEPVLGNSHLPGSGNGHQDEAAEAQQWLFSWAAFMADEPETPPRMNGKPKPAASPCASGR